MAVDTYVLNTQKWLNKTYNGKYGYNSVEENGQTGWNTIYALIRAFQIEIGISEPSNNFGDQTSTKFYEKFKRTGKESAIVQQEDGDESSNNVYGIIQGALFCKGYSIGTNTPTCHFYNGTGNAIKKLKSDAGLDDNTSDVTLNIMKALLSMDYFYSYKTDEKTLKTIEIQRYLNKNYEDYIGLRPCDGVYGSRTNKAIIYALQAEEGMLRPRRPWEDEVDGCATGEFFDITKQHCPTIPYNQVEKDYKGNIYTSSQIKRFTKLVNIALFFNGFGTITGALSEALQVSALNNFQSKYGIPVKNACDITSWMSLFVSCGNRSRSAIACDCATLITKDNIDVLVDNDYKYIGRYVSGQIWDSVKEEYVDKCLSTNELQLLFNKGIRVFPIFQGAGNKVSYFTVNQAKEDAKTAYEAAENLYLQFGAIIYFAVDCDVMDYQVTNNILPYFQALQKEFITKCRGKYRIGIYASRNTCTRVCDAGYASSSFVSDMATGYSGNIGFPIPDNWAFDQFATVTIRNKNNTRSIEIDKDGFSGKYLGISYEYSVQENGLDGLSTNANSFILVNRSGVSLPVYESMEHYNWPVATAGTQYVTSGKKIGEIKPNEFYLFYGTANPSLNTVHKILFNDGKDVRIGYVDGTHEYPGNGETNMNVANYNQRPQYHEPYSCLRYVPETNEYKLVSSAQNQEITINKPVVYFDVSGNYKGILGKGDKIIINSGNVNNTGQSRPWCYRVSKIILSNGTEITQNTYVSVGLEYETIGSERAWY